MATYYCDQTDLEYRVTSTTIEQWADDDRDGSADTGVITAACKWAYNEINHALTDLYAAQLPFTSATLPPILENIAITFAIYWLWSRGQEGTTDSAFAANYEEARERLNNIAAGSEALFGPDGDVVAAAAANDLELGLAQSTTIDQDPIFTRSTLAPWMARTAEEAQYGINEDDD